MWVWNDLCCSPRGPAPLQDHRRERQAGLPDEAGCAVQLARVPGLHALYKLRGGGGSVREQRGRPPESGGLRLWLGVATASVGGASGGGRPRREWRRAAGPASQPSGGELGRRWAGRAQGGGGGGGDIPAPCPRHPSHKVAYSARHARAMPAPRPRHCPCDPRGENDKY
eukprot:gene10943-biopygen13890